LKSPCRILFDDRNWLLVSDTVLNLNQKKRILELGCGIGTHLTHFAKMGHECTGIDISKDSIRKANFLNKELCTFIIADGCHLPFTNECFDIIYSTETLSHVADLPRSLSEQIHSLKQRGELMVRDSNLLFPLVLMNLMFFYPLRTHGKYGGLRWILNYDKVINNIYDTGSYGKDENIKTLNWWRTALMNYPNLKLKVATTSYVVAHPNWFTRLLTQLTGQVVVVAEKVSE
jgi:SAM-dependent methyltransferase